MTAPCLIAQSWEQLVQGEMRRVPSPSLCTGDALLSDTEIFTLPRLGNSSCPAPSMAPRATRPAADEPRHGSHHRPWRPMRGHLAGAAWPGVLRGAGWWQGHSGTAHQAGRRNGRQAACRPGKLEPFPGCCQLCCKKLLLGGGSHSFMGPGVFVPPSNGNSRCLPGCSGSGQLYSHGRSVAKRNSCESEETALGGPYPSPEG